MGDCLMRITLRYSTVLACCGLGTQLSWTQKMQTMLWTVWLVEGSNDTNNVVYSVVGAEYLAELGSNDTNNVVDSVVGTE